MKNLKPWFNNYSYFRELEIIFDLPTNIGFLLFNTPSEMDINIYNTLTVAIINHLSHEKN